MVLIKNDKKTFVKLVVVLYTCNLGTQEVVTGGLHV